jgi:hypothetical protein
MTGRAANVLVAAIFGFPARQSHPTSQSTTKVVNNHPK